MNEKAKRVKSSVTPTLAMNCLSKSWTGIRFEDKLKYDFILITGAILGS